MATLGGVESIPGLDSLWRLSTGDPRVLIAILDGPVDLDHPTFAGARIASVGARDQEGLDGAATRHGTLVASLILGRSNPSSPVVGVAPGCGGLVVPIFHDSPGVTAPPRARQIDLAHAISLAVERGAWIINVSAGEPSPSESAHPLLVRAVENATRRGVLIVAAVGNDGCDCLEAPAALAGVLAVGAMDDLGRPLESSNHGLGYRSSGILALGSGLWGALAGGGKAIVAGSSYATAVVSGVAGLLASAALVHGVRLQGAQLRGILLDSALECRDHFSAPERCLIGRLDLPRALMVMNHRELSMSDKSLSAPGQRFEGDSDRVGTLGDGHSAGVAPSGGVVAQSRGGDASAARGCGCASCQAKDADRGSLVFALGQVGSDLVSEARRDSITQHMDGPAPNPYDPGQMLAYLANNPWESASITWTLNFDQMPLYAIAPAGPFAATSYELLRGFLQDQIDKNIERVSIPGGIVGQTRLLNGQVVPTMVPEPRGMSSWTTKALVDEVVKDQADKATSAAYVGMFLDKVYHELRNLGRSAPDRALNYAATNAFHPSNLLEMLRNEPIELDSVEVERSSICRPESDCWDVKISFFHPQRQVPSLRKVLRLTVDVSDVVPVRVGPMRSWSSR